MNNGNIINPHNSNIFSFGNVAKSNIPLKPGINKIPNIKAAEAAIANNNFELLNTFVLNKEF